MKTGLTHIFATIQPHHRRNYSSNLMNWSLVSVAVIAVYNADKEDCRMLVADSVVLISVRMVVIRWAAFLATVAVAWHSDSMDRNRRLQTTNSNPIQLNWLMCPMHPESEIKYNSFTITHLNKFCTITTIQFQ